jgi:GT2 family glycosyltransferase
VRLVRSAENLGYARGNNELARLARGRHLCLLGSDTEVGAGAIDALVDFLAASPGHGAAAPRLVNPDGTLQPACMRWPTPVVALVHDMCWRGWPLLRRIDDRYYYRDFDHLHDRDVEQPPGTCLLVRGELWRQLGGFDESLWLFYNDVDLCRRLWSSGHAIRYLAGPLVRHELGASTRGFGPRVVLWARDRLAYYRKHHGKGAWCLVRLMLRLRAIQEWWLLGRRHRDAAERRSARRELRRVLREALRTDTFAPPNARSAAEGG